MALPPALLAIVPAVSAEMSGGILGREAPGDDRTAALAVVALTLCHRYAPAAPIEVMQEAAVRAGGWLMGRQPHVIARRVKTPDGTESELTYRSAATANVLKESGAETMLSPWKIRHARAIG